MGCELRVKRLVTILMMIVTSLQHIQIHDTVHEMYNNYL